MSGKRKRLYLRGFFSFIITLFFIVIFCSMSYGKDEVNLGLIGIWGHSGDVSCVEIFQNDTSERDYILCGTNTGFLIIDVTDPNIPKEKAFLEIGPVYDIAFYNFYDGVRKYALLANGENGLSILDITLPTTPIYAGKSDTPSSAWRVAICGNYAYVADYDNGLVIIDITDPTSPTCAGGFDTAGYAWGVAISGNYAYLADSNNGLVIIDISNPANPSFAREFGTRGKARGVTISGNYAYVACGGELIIINISDPSDPIYAGECNTSGTISDIAISGNYAYVTSGFNRLLVIDITNSTAPTIVGRFHTPGMAQRIASSGKLAYVTYTGFGPMNDFHSGLAIIDMSDPIGPTYAGGFDTSGRAYDLAISGNYAYIANWEGGLALIDITDPTAPTYVGGFDTPGWAEGVAISDDYAYVADYDNGLVILDITDPTVPTYAGGFDTPGKAYDVSISGNYAYVADYDNGLVILDITDPTAPTYAGGFDTPGYAWGVDISGNYAYVADYDNGLVILDITDPTAPAYAGGFDTAGYAWGVDISGNYAYVADGGGGLVIINIDDPTDPTFARRFDTSGDARGVAISGNYAYVADSDNGLVSIDITNPNSPTYAGRFDTAGYTRDVAISENYAYVADDDNGLVIIDITDPTNPTYAGGFATNGYTQDLVISGNHAFIADDDRGVVVFDITDPTRPIYIGGFNTDGKAHGVDISDNYAYIADYDNGLVIIDITDPTNLAYTGGFNTLGLSHSVAISGNHAYVADEDKGLVIIDITDPTVPIYAGGLDTLGLAYGVDISGNYAFVADEDKGLVIIDITNPTNPTYAGGFDTSGKAYDVAISGNYAYIADGDRGLVIILISDPTNPIYVERFSTSEEAYGVSISGNFAYVAAGNNGLMIIDISDPSNPTYAGGFATSVFARGLSISENYAYIASGGNGLAILDITDPIGPIYTGEFDTYGWAYGLAISGNYAYIAHEDKGLVIMDVTDPTAPAYAGEFDTPGWAYGVAFSENYAYVADHDSGIVIIDVTDPTAPAYASGFDTSGWAHGIAVSENYAYVADREKGLAIIDISDPTNPAYAGGFDTPGAARSVDFSGNYAYLADYYNGLMIIDLSDPTAPAYTGGFDTPGSVEDVAISGNYAYVPDYDNGLVIIDISDPANPTYAGGFDTPGKAYGVAVSGNYAYVSDGDGGLIILNITDPSAPAYAGRIDTPGSAIGITISDNYAYVAEGIKSLSIFRIIDAPPTQGNLILCAGGPASTTNPFWPPSQALANLVYSSFLDQGYPNYFIYYLNPNPHQDIDKDGTLDPLVVDDFTPTVDDIKYAITDWAQNQLNTGPLYIYLIGQGTEDQFQIMPGQMITAGELSECIDKFQNGYTDDEGTYHPGTNREVVVIIESTASDTFIDDLTDDNITVITSGSEGPSYTDVDVTFIDRVPNYPYDAEKNSPEAGDTVTFVAHGKLSDRPFLPLLQTNYIWYMDGIPMGDGIVQLQQGQDNTVSIDWIWDNKRHEIMIIFDPENSLTEQSEENNILYDFTDALIVGMAIEKGLVDVFPDFQRDLGIGSLSFEDWFQRQIKIWNIVLLEKAGEMKSDSTLDIQDRVRGVISYHEDGSLMGGNCPLVWKDVDMLWGKLASDIQWYSENNWAWFYEGSLPHELSHARYLPDTYILDLAASCIEIIDDGGYLVTDTYYMPAFGWDTVYSNKNQGMMSADYAGRYSLFDAFLLNRIAAERAQGCNTNGCCSHDTDWYVKDFPEDMYLRIVHLDGFPWVNARLDIYTRQGSYGNSRVDNIIDYTSYTDSNGRALLPSNVFTNSSQEFVLKISSPDGYSREYRFVERTDFHIAYWAGSKDSFDYTIKTDFDPVPFADKVENVSGHKRGETFDLTFKGRNFKEGGYIRFSNSEVICNSISYINENEVRVNITIPENNIRGSISFRLYNPDGKFVRVKSPYEQGIDIVFENAKPYARFTAYDIGDRIPRAYYFNGLWSDDCGRLFKGIDGPLPIEGTGPIASYEWDFGDGSPYSYEPFTIHNYISPGTYNVTLKVTDMDGETASINKTFVLNGRTFYQDADRDTYGNPNVECLAFTQPDGYVLNNLDCNDNDPNTYTGVIEQCDGKDNDCDGSPGSEEVDVDEDTFMVCEGDCNDSDPNTNPGAMEICDKKDNNCDGTEDEEGAWGCATYYKDQDSDGYGLDGDTHCLCSPEGYYQVTQGGDPDDTDPSVPSIIMPYCQFRAAITATGQVITGAENISTIIIGIDPDAYTQPFTQPPTSPYTVIMQIAGEYSEDIRLPGSEEEWELNITVGDKADPEKQGFFPVLSWDPNALCPPDPNTGYLSLYSENPQGLRSLLVPDMSRTGQYQTKEEDGVCFSTNECDFTYYILWSRDISVEMELPGGWSMISLPVVPDNPRSSHLFPDATVIYGFQKGSGYTRLKENESLEPGTGYWILLPGAHTYPLTGKIIEGYTMPAEDGWFMMGGCTCSARATLNIGKIVVIYSFVKGSGYQRISDFTQIDPEKGYWFLFSNTTDQSELRLTTQFYQKKTTD